MLAGLFSIVVLLQIFVVVLAGLVLYHVIKQQGRLLNRVDIIEDRLNFVFRSVARLEKEMEERSPSLLPPMPMPESPNPAMPPEPVGLAVGTTIAPFRLPDLGGQRREWESFRGKRLLLVHWNPQCGFCDLIAPELAGLQGPLEAANVHMLFLSYGDAETNRQMLQEHGLKATVLLMKDISDNIEAFHHQGTPAAYLVDEQGNVARSLSVGSDKVVALAKAVSQEAVSQESAAKPLAPQEPEAASNGHHAEPQGLKTGTPAPLFSIPDLDGKPVSLETYRGKTVLLVFSDPQCGPCDQLVPELERLHRAHQNDGLQVIIVGRGDPKENRRKRDEHQVTFPVALQSRKWTVAKQYGTLATPVAFLINEEGIIIRDVAVGIDDILALAAERVPVRMG